jgi:hypothetical protein
LFSCFGTSSHTFKKHLRPAVQVSLKPLESTSRQIRLQLGSWWLRWLRWV